MKNNVSRRQFIRSSLAGTALAALPHARVLGANQDIRLGVIGVGSFIKIGGKGRGDIRDFRQIPGVRVVALCDCDEKHLQYEAQQFEKRNERVRLYRDFRALLDNPNIDAVSITTPNHWHALMTILACQAGKDVFVQKPASHNIFEGRKMVEAMHRYERVVQATHGPRNSGATEEAIEYAWQGHLGPIQYVYGLNYKPRMSTKQNFIDVMRSRKLNQLTTDALEGHLSCGLVHMANTSYRVGRAAPVAQALEAIQGHRHLAPVFERFQGHLDANGIDLKKSPLTLGASLTMDPQAERYVGPGSDQANPHAAGTYRKPFVVPDKV